jgi:hypothetical protein
MKARLKNAQDANAEAVTAALADGVAVSKLDASVPQMLTWRSVVTKGVQPTPRYHHCAWVVDPTRGGVSAPGEKPGKNRRSASMWVTHGSLNGKKLPGAPFVLCLRTLVWHTRDACEESGDAPACVIGAAALVAPNDAAYVFGGAEKARTPKRGFGGFLSRGDDDDQGEEDGGDSETRNRVTVRCLDLTEDPGPPDAELGGRIPAKHGGGGPRKKKRMEWIDGAAEDGAAGLESEASKKTSNALAAQTRDVNVKQEGVIDVLIDDAMTSSASDSSATLVAQNARVPQEPCARAHHTASLVGGEVYVFGGSRVGGGGDAGDSILGDLWAFDGAEGTWRLVTGHGDRGGVVGGAGPRTKALPVVDAPSPRTGHVAGVADDRFLLIFGGDEDGCRLADTKTHVFDSWSQRWVDVRITGKPPRARSGHASCVVDAHWYVSGGGDDREARPETYRLDLSDAAQGKYHWTVVNTGVGDGQAAAAGREGMTLVPFRGATGEFLVAFGGSDGTCHGDVRVMRVSDWTTGKKANSAR